MKLYRGFTSQEEIDAEYNPMLGIPDSDAVIQGWFDRSTAAIASLTCNPGVKYGPTCEEYCDVFPAGDGAPIHVFVHGGYWRRFSARDHDFVARPLVEAGITTVVVNYALCPRVSLDEIVRQTRAAVAWAFDRAGEFGADPARLTISGHSAGAHLAAMAMATDWPGAYGLPPDIIKGGVAISGLYDLGFVPFSFIQPKVQATWRQVTRLSPMFHLPESAGPLVLAVGGLESAEFRRQSAEFHAAWRAAGLVGGYLEVPDTNHLTVLEQVEQRDSALHRALIQMARQEGDGFPQ